MSDPVDVVIAGTRIARIEPAGSLAGDAIDATGCVILPGLINGHTHSHEVMHKGRYRKLPLELWMHGTRPPFQTQRLTPSEVYVRTILAGIEQLRGGATTVVDDVHQPGLDRLCIDAVFRAYRDLGLRAYVSVSLFDVPFHRAMPFVEEELDAPQRASLVPDVPSTEMMLGIVEELVGRADGDGRVTFVVAPSAPQRCSDRLIGEAVAIARRHGAPIVTHVNETRLQAVTAQRAYGATMVEHLDRLGVLGPGLSLIHGVWLTPGDIALLAASGTSVQHNPVSNLRLGSGLAPVAAMLEQGVNVSFGTDGCGSCVTASALDGLRHAALLHGLRGDDPDLWVGAGEALAMATTAGARALGRDDLGRLEVGATADMICLRMEGVAFTPLNDPLRQLVHGASDVTVDTVLVDGRPVLVSGRLVNIDEGDALEAARELHARLAPEFDRIDTLVDGILPAYARIHSRCLAEPIPADTYPARFPGL